jgi:hypothetical protein
MKSSKKMMMVLMVLAMGISAQASMQITEWMYSGADGEFIEFTNLGSSSVDMTGWNYNDSDLLTGPVSLSSFGTVAPGESVILCEPADQDFRDTFGLSSSVKVIGLNDNNLGRSDAINLYNGTTLIDSLVYDDATGKGPRTQNKSCSVPYADLSLTTASSAWVLSAVGDPQGSWAGSWNGNIASPGTYVIPEPMTVLFLAISGLVGIIRRR